MSYASIASHNAPPSSQQPPPDSSLLDTQSSTANNIVDNGVKFNVVSTNKNRSMKNGNNGYRKAGTEDEHIWEAAKQYLLRPGLAGGLVGLVNLGIIAGVGHTYYAEPHFRRDTTAISSTVAGALALFSLEGYAAERYRKTPRGQDEERRAEEEGSFLYRHACEIVLRPGILGGLVGLLNTAILGTVGYYTYTSWNKPSWDRRTLLAASVGLFTVWASEGYIAERYRGSRQ